MKKVMMLTTTAYMSERFNRNNILILEEMGYEVHVVANFDKGNPTTKAVLDKFKEWIEEHHGKWISISVTKSPADISNNYRAYKEIIALIKEHNYEFIHCHTPVGGVLGRCVAHRTHTKVIYTAHGFHFFDGAPILNWILYYPVERFLSRWTDMLITINQEDYNRAKKSFHAKRTEYIPGIGVNIERFSRGKVDRSTKRKDLQLESSDKMLLSVGELNKGKNHASVIKAIKILNNKNIKYFICGQGRLREELQNLIYRLQMQEQVYLLGYREDISALCQAADLFVFPSLREGLPVALMEAIASKVPVACSRVRGNRDLVKDESYLFNPSSVEEISKCIKRSLSENSYDVIEENYNRLLAFDENKVNEVMRKLYTKF